MRTVTVANEIARRIKERVDSVSTGEYGLLGEKLGLSADVGLSAARDMFCTHKEITKKDEEKHDVPLSIRTVSLMRREW